MHMPQPRSARSPLEGELRDKQAVVGASALEHDEAEPLQASCCKGAALPRSSPRLAAIAEQARHFVAAGLKPASEQLPVFCRMFGGSIHVPVYSDWS